MEIVVGHLFRMDITRMCLDAIPDSNKIILIDISTTGEARNYAENRKKHIEYVRGPSYPNQWGSAKLWNEGAKLCKGEWFAIMTNDILINKGEIEKIEKVTRHCADDIGVLKQWDTPPKGLAINIFRRKCFDDVGEFDEIFHPTGGEDQDFYLRATQKGWKIKWIPIDWFHVEGGHHCRIEVPREQYNKFVNKWGFAPEGPEWHAIVDKATVR